MKYFSILHLMPNVIFRLSCLALLSHSSIVALLEILAWREMVTQLSKTFYAEHRRIVDFLAND